MKTLIIATIHRHETETIQNNAALLDTWKQREHKDLLSLDTFYRPSLFKGHNSLGLAHITMYLISVYINCDNE